MNKVNPKDIPEGSRRYDMTLLDKGEAKGADGAKFTIAKFVIDNGPFAGKPVSTKLDMFNVLSYSKYFGRDPEYRVARCSAFLYVNQESTEKKVIVTYHMDDFESPRDEPTYKVKQNARAKFRR